MRLPIFACHLGVLALSVVSVLPIRAESDNTHHAQREYFSVDVGALVREFGERHIVSEEAITQHAWYQMDGTQRVVVPSGSEAYLLEPENRNDDFVGYKIVGLKPTGKSVDGHFYLLQSDPKLPRDMVLARFAFAVDAEVQVPGDRSEFLLAKGRHFQRLWSEEMAGAAMFRHLATTSLQQLGQTAKSTGPNWPMRPSDSVDDTIQLMSGGRAVSENLQLDNQLATTDIPSRMQSLSDVAGITVREIDWSARLSKEPTQLDPLANSIPHDQHAVFLPSFEALAKLVEQGNQLAKPAVQWFEPQSRETDVLGFYQQQLGLPLNSLTRQIGGALIDEVALTGSDPYFRTGTDLAVLMQTTQPTLLQQAIMTQVAAQASLFPGVTQVGHNFTGHSVTQWSTKDRRFCSLVGVTDDSVVVTNSLRQMMKVLSCADNTQRALASLDEYQFFRQRYPRHTADESALVVISDATIRRWCGPAWRIAASRRTRARATIAEMTMSHAEAILHGTVGETRRLSSTASMPGAGDLWLSANGVRSDQYGTLQFQSPIVELDLQFATSEEIKLYESWRTQYERQWRGAFDPIALQLALRENSVSADLSVIPLMIRSRYNSWLSWIGKARLKPNAGDTHQEAIASIASIDVALDTQSNWFSFARTFFNQQGMGVDLVNWVDGSVSFYLDYDEQWVKRFDERPRFALNNEDMIREMPFGCFIPSRDNFRMTAFVVAARTILEQFTPNMIRWDQVQHNGLAYVVATAVEDTPAGSAEDMPRLYYVTTPEGLTLSLNENVIRRAIDRHLARKEAQLQVAQVVEPSDQENSTVELSDKQNPEPQIAASITGQGAAVLAQSNYPNSVRRMSRLAWSNIPILNYFRHQYPERDPLDVYQQLLGEKLTEPAGGQYAWNERLETYESTLYGHHLAPRLGPALSQSLGLGDKLQTTLSFEDGGLRATVNLTVAD